MNTEHKFNIYCNHSIQHMLQYLSHMVI